METTLTTITYRSHTIVTTAKVSAEIQDSWRKIPERIRKVEKKIMTNFDVRLESAHSFITHFSH